jgi:peptide/nickel transport system permease protein
VLAYLVRRLCWSVVLVLAVALVTFIIFFVIPTSHVQNATHRETTTNINSAVGVSGPVYVEYLRFVWDLARGSFGTSFRSQQNVRDLVLSAAPVTASLVIGGAVTWLLIALPIAILSAIRPRSLLDRTATILVLAGISVHPIWLGLILLYVFGFKLHLFPIGQYCNLVNPPPGAVCGGLVQWFWHLVLPWLTFASLYGALYVRMIRANVLEAMHEDYVRTARAKGAGEMRIISRHVLRNALLPLITMLGMDVGVAMGGTLFIETVYGLPGLGKMMTRGLQTYDLPVLLGVVVFMTISIVLLNLVIDVVYTLCDPRMRAHSGIDDEDVVQPRLRKPARAVARAPA